MSWKLALQYARQRIVDELLPLAGRRPVDLILIRSPGSEDFDRLFDEAILSKLATPPNRRERGQIRMLATLTQTSESKTKERPKALVQAIASRSLIPRQGLSENDSAQWTRKNDLRLALTACLDELGGAFRSTPYVAEAEALQNEVDETLRLGPPAEFCWRRHLWYYWLFSNALRPHSICPVHAEHNFGTLPRPAAVDLNFHGKLPPSGWFAEIEDGVRATLFLIDSMLGEGVAPAPVALPRHSPPESQSAPHAAPNETAAIAWPPDSGWHFRADQGQAAYRGTVVSLTPKLLLFLRILAEAAQSDAAVTWRLLSDKWVESGGAELYRDAIRSDIGDIRMALRQSFAAESDDPIPNMVRGDNCSWKLALAALEPRPPERIP